MELYRKHRPKALYQVVGQPDACRTLKGLVEKKRVPHAVLFTGPSGCGKTTMARIVAKELACHKNDLCEVNAATSRGIDTIRDIQSRMNSSSVWGACRVWLLDEVHKFTSDAQNGILKILEDGPKHAYFFLCTTEPNKLIRTIQTRCTEVKCRLLTHKELKQLVVSVADKERASLDDEVADRIAECAEGSARKALVILDQVIGIKDKEDQLNAVQKSDSKRQAFDLYKALNPFKGKPSWPEIADALKEIEDDAEGLRRMVLACAMNDCLKGGPRAGRAYLILDVFQYDTFQSGKPGLVRMCWEAVHSQS